MRIGQNLRTQLKLRIGLKLRGFNECCKEYYIGKDDVKSKMEREKIIIFNYS